MTHPYVQEKCKSWEETECERREETKGKKGRQRKGREENIGQWLGLREQRREWDKNRLEGWKYQHKRRRKL